MEKTILVLKSLSVLVHNSSLQCALLCFAQCSLKGYSSYHFPWEIFLQLNRPRGLEVLIRCLKFPFVKSVVAVDPRYI